MIALPPTDATIAVLDAETTGRSPIRDRVYEIGAVIRTPGQPDREYHRWVDLRDLDVDLSPDGPNAEALAVGRFWDRHPQWYIDDRPGKVLRETDIAAELADLLAGAVLAGVQIGSFDAPFLDATLARHDLQPSWSYRHLEISSYASCAAGLLVSPGLDTLLEVFGVPVDPEQRHTALGDARLETRLLDAARARVAVTERVVDAALSIHARDKGFLRVHGTAEGKALIASADAVLALDGSR